MVNYQNHPFGGNAMTHFVTRFGNCIEGVLSGIDRLVIRGTLRRISYALGMSAYLNANNVLLREFGDAELQHLGPIASLRELHLAATRVTDAGMSHIGKLANLERLYLAKCEVSDAGLAHIASLRQLRAINLYGTKLTSAGLEHLARLEALRLLSVTDVKLSPSAVDKLKQTLPQLTVTDYNIHHAVNALHAVTQSRSRRQRQPLPE
jgi:hypothetical protein